MIGYWLLHWTPLNWVTPPMHGSKSISLLAEHRSPCRSFSHASTSQCNLAIANGSQTSYSPVRMMRQWITFVTGSIAMVCPIWLFCDPRPPLLTGFSHILSSDGPTIRIPWSSNCNTVMEKAGTSQSNTDAGAAAGLSFKRRGTGMIAV